MRTGNALQSLRTTARSEEEIERLQALLYETTREREEYNGKHQAACIKIDRLRAQLTFP
jgi:hypothetical protein